jgi:opine dehydrogenase
MKTIAVLGAGAGGAAAAADLSLRGYAVRLWNRSPETLEPYRRSGEVRYEGLLGSGAARPEAITADLREALDAADAAVVCLPALAHEGVAARLAAAGASLPVVLHPGHTGGALHVRQVFRAAGAALPPLAELSTLAYVARVYEPGTVSVTGVAERLRAACLPGGDDALAAALELYPVSRVEPDVLATDLANVNLVLHPPGAVLGAAWVEATGGDFLFYAEAVTPGVARVMRALDGERLAVARAYGHELEPLHEEMAAIGTAEREAAARGDAATAIARGAANRGIRAPDSLAHRYYAEDFAYGVVPLLVLAEKAGVRAPVAAALLEVAQALLGRDLRANGLGAERLGLSGLDRDGVLELVGGGRIAA